MKIKKLVYIAHPYRADTEDGIRKNIAKAIEFGKEVYRVGYAPLVPHVNSSAITGLISDNQAAIEYDNNLLERCDILVVCGNIISAGVQGEIDYVKGRKPIVYLPDIKDMTPLWGESKNA